MVNYSFSIYDLEYFMLIFVRIAAFVYTAPFFSMQNTPRRYRVALSLCLAALLYQVLTPAEAVVTDTLMEYAIVVAKEIVTGLLIGFGTNICITILNFAGSVVDMEIGLSMMTLMDPTTRENTSITGVMYQYMFMMMLIASGMYRYLLGALADTFKLIPVNGAVLRTDALLESVIAFMAEYVIIAFRIILPVFCAIMLLNAVLGVMAKVSPQMNMFAIGIQLKILTGLSVIFLTLGMMPKASDFIYQEMRRVITSFVEAIM
ncbi:MAG: flagellar biosynthetic protein FliR [Candidatus Gastranaerophilales bacterium]|nr:flagellar biosynthetic protein FliR [Candidatus Gastranaerophilales bacterium]